MKLSVLIMLVIFGSIECFKFPRLILAAQRNKIYAVKDDADNRLLFAGVKFKKPVSQCLDTLNINQPSPIQNASIFPLTTGMSAILHAATGTGKTLAYLLPLMKRLYNSGVTTSDLRFYSLILVPTKELAVQVATDISSLLDGDTSSIHLCLSGTRKGLDNINASVIVGTPFKVLDTLRASSPETQAIFLRSVEYLVLDEVDRLISALSKYATNEDKRNRKTFDNPCVELLKLLLSTKSGNIVNYDQQKPSFPRSAATEIDLQVVAASATVGRPLRRELNRLFPFPVSGTGDSGGEFPVIRPAVINSKEPEKDEDGMIERKKKNSRAIGIPESIDHCALLDSKESENLSGKLALLKEYWVNHPELKRGILFLPQPEDVKQALGILKFWGIKEAHDLQQSLGIVAQKPDEKNKNKNKKSINKEEKEDQEIPILLDTEIPNLSRTASLIQHAQTSKIGASSRRKEKDTTEDIETDNKMSSSTENKQRELFVVPFSGSRGLHIQGVECVMLLNPPKTMDEYLHMAGRTGRLTNDPTVVSEGVTTGSGTVVTAVTLEELKRVQSWQTPLNIVFDVDYS